MRASPEEITIKEQIIEEGLRQAGSPGYPKDVPIPIERLLEVSIRRSIRDKVRGTLVDENYSLQTSKGIPHHDWRQTISLRLSRYNMLQRKKDRSPWEELELRVTEQLIFEAERGAGKTETVEQGELQRLLRADALLYQKYRAIEERLRGEKAGRDSTVKNILWRIRMGPLYNILTYMMPSAAIGVVVGTTLSEYRFYRQQGGTDTFSVWFLNDFKARFLQDATQTPESREIPSSPTPFEMVLEKSLPVFLPDTRTYRDNILDAYAMSQYFLGDAFRYTGGETIEYQGRKERAHRFAQIGEKSGYLGRKDEGKDRWKTTTLVMTVNTFLETERLSPEEIASWISWMYERSFQVRLDPKRIKVAMDKKKKVTEISYESEEDFKREVFISVAEIMEEKSAHQPGGRLSKKVEIQPILDSRGRLLLPSGLSPVHDIVVPAELLRQNPTFTLQLNGYGTWKKRTAAQLMERIQSLEARQNAQRLQRKTVRAFGRELEYKLIAPLLEWNDPMIKLLADHLLSNVPQDDHQTKIMKLVQFVQDLPYAHEYDLDVNRNGFLTLFNGGGDCNNLSDLFAELMIASGYRVALLRVIERRNDNTTHVMGGILAQYFPEGTHWFLNQNPEEEWAPIELTRGREFLPGMPEMDKTKVTVFDIEVIDPENR